MTLGYLKPFAQANADLFVRSGQMQRSNTAPTLFLGPAFFIRFNMKNRRIYTNHINSLIKTTGV